MRYMSLLVAVAVFVSRAHAANEVKTVSLNAPALTPMTGSLGIPALGPSALNLNFQTPSPFVTSDLTFSPNAPSALPGALAPSVIGRAAANQALLQPIEAFAAQPLTQGERSLAALSAFHETFQGLGPDFSTGKGMAALSALYESAASKKREAPSLAAAGIEPDAPQKAVEAVLKPVKKRAAARLNAFEKDVKSVRSGRFGIAAIYQVPDSSGRMAVEFDYTLDRRRLEEGDLARKIASGAVTQAVFKAAEPALKKEAKRMKAEFAKLQDANMADVREAKKEIGKVAKQLVKAQLEVGRDLQSWGVPNVAAVGLEGYMKYVSLYRLSGQPTELGAALHEILAPMVAKDPKVLGRITQQGMDTAILELSRGLNYRKDPESDDAKKLMRLGGLMDFGHDYPEWRAAFSKRAAKALAKTGPRELPKAGFRLMPVEMRPTPVLKSIVSEVLGEVGDMMQAKAPKAQIQQGVELVSALHAALALPFGPMGFAPVRHAQLLTILPNLIALNVHPSVISAVIRSYPLGESLWRMGVFKLWADGLTGKGVKVAVIDDGASFSNPDFEGVKHKNVNLTRDRGDDTLGPHGTAMTDIIHAIAPEAQFTVYQALSNSDLPGVMLTGEQTDDAIAKALNMAEKEGANIISMSLGAGYGMANDRIAKRIAQLKKKGIIVIVAAGNSGDSLPPGMQNGTPGTAPAAITVGAVDYHGRKADFSSKGPVFNPDNPINLKDKPDIYAFGVNIKAAMALPSALYATEPVPYTRMSGTSPATPHVSGVVALMLEAARLSGLALDGSVAGVVKQALLSTAYQVAYREDIPAIPVLIDAPGTVEKFLQLLKKKQG